jgi:hypothetical protein
MPVSRRAADLYGLPLEEFTPARDALARELRGAGNKEGAAEVKALRKPSVSAWAVNQAVRRRPQEAKALVKAGDELRKAQRGAVSGRDTGGLREATAAHRRLVEELTEAARDALEERGAAPPATVTRIAQTLRAASIDKESAKALTAGTLSEDVEQTGFGPLLSVVPSAPRRRPRKAARKPKAKPAPKRTPPPPKPPKPKRDPNAARRVRLQRELEQARDRVRELEERLQALDS